MTSEEKLARATVVFVGVIQAHHFDSWPLFRLNIPGEDQSNAKYWKILRREVRIETVLRGAEGRKVVDVYEIFWTGGTSGDWNSTQDGERVLFLVRVENHRYHVVRDWWRSIYPVTTGPHSRLPLDASHPLWERIALMNWWIERSDDAVRVTYPYFMYSDPAQTLSLWRTIKLERGLLRHPSARVRVQACRALLELGAGQDECWETLSLATGSTCMTVAPDAVRLMTSLPSGDMCRRRDFLCGRSTTIPARCAACLPRSTIPGCGPSSAAYTLANILAIQTMVALRTSLRPRPSSPTAATCR
jgi:hypothetical protein